MSGSRSKILLLTHRVPYPPDRGDRIRSYHMLRYLADRYEVYLGALADGPVDDRSIAALEALTVDHAVVPLGKRRRWLNAACSLIGGRSATEGLFASEALRSRVRSWARSVKFDAAIAFCSSMVQFTQVPELAETPLVVDLVDVDSRKWLDYAVASRGLKRRLYELEAARVRRLECTLPSRARAITLVSEAEAEIYRSFCPNQKTFAISNGVDLDYFRPDFPVSEPRPNQCVFVGVLNYRPNVDGLLWFCEHVWPGVIAQKPDATLAIVGKHPTFEVRHLGTRPGIRLVGEVPDVRPYVSESRFVIAPLQIARGIQNKVLEAMAMGKAVIATPQALEGLHVEDGDQSIAAADALEWSMKIGKLFQDDELSQRIGTSGRDYVMRTHHWTACLSRLGQIVNDVPSVRREVIQLPHAISMAEIHA